MTHTPAPWVVCESENWVCVDSGENGTTIAEIGEKHGGGMEDARLIAAAPDLLEALDSACDDLEQAILTQIAAKHHALAESSQESLDAARAAIAKAKGEDV